MKQTMCCKSVWIFICLAYVTVQLVNAQEAEENKVQDAMKLMERLVETRKGLDKLRLIINQMDSEPRKTQKRTCAVNGGMSPHCTVALLGRQQDAHNWWRSGLSPGKKRAEASGAHARIGRDLSDIANTRRGLQALKRIMDDMENEVIVQQKKNCQFNLGGHCATESAASVAHQWHFLNSPLSPGRKRRDTSLLKRLNPGRQVW